MGTVLVKEEARMRILCRELGVQNLNDGTAGRDT